MLGYDSLFGSHYDDYKITYSEFTTKFDDSVFDVPIKGMFYSRLTEAWGWWSVGLKGSMGKSYERIED